MSIFLVTVISYLLGCIPFAYLIGRYARHVDIRELGDGNVGAANAYRQLGFWAGTGAFLGDAGKGAAAIYFARWLGVSQPVVLVAGVLAVAGHCWPVFLGFRGGRGMSTTLGVLLSLVPGAMSVVMAVSGICFIATRSVIITAVPIFVALPLVAWLFAATGDIIAYCIILPCIPGFAHVISARRAKQAGVRTA